MNLRAKQKAFAVTLTLLLGLWSTLMMAAHAWKVGILLALGFAMATTTGMLMVMAWADVLRGRRRNR